MTRTATPSVFNFNSTTIRAFADENGETWFSSGDICSALGYNNESDAINKYCREKGIGKYKSLADDDDQESTYINEGNLYRLIINSSEEVTQAFELKVTGEIIPAIRKAGCTVTSQAADVLSPLQLNALQQLVTQRSGDSGVIRAEIWGRFSDQFKVGSYSKLPAESFVEAVTFLAAITTSETLPSARYQYPLTMLDQPHFIAPYAGKACLSLSMLSDPAQFKSPLMSLLNQLTSEGYDVSAPLEEAVAMRAAMQQTDKVLDEIRMIALKARSGRL